MAVSAYDVRCLEVSAVHFFTNGTRKYHRVQFCASQVVIFGFCVSISRDSVRIAHDNHMVTTSWYERDNQFIAHADFGSMSKNELGLLIISYVDTSILWVPQYDLNLRDYGCTAELILQARLPISLPPFRRAVVKNYPIIGARDEPQLPGSITWALDNPSNTIVLAKITLRVFPGQVLKASSFTPMNLSRALDKSTELLLPEGAVWVMIESSFITTTTLPTCQAQRLGIPHQSLMLAAIDCHSQLPYLS